jgi:hypothetical protein
MPNFIRPFVYKGKAYETRQYKVLCEDGNWTTFFNQEEAKTLRSAGKKVYGVEGIVLPSVAPTDDDNEAAEVFNKLLMERRAQLREQMRVRRNPSGDALVAHQPPNIQERNRPTGWFEVDQADDGVWVRVLFADARRYSDVGKKVRYIMEPPAMREEHVDTPMVVMELMEEKRIRQPGWYEKDWDGDGVWTMASFQEARMLQAKGWSIRFRNKERVLVVWSFSQRRRRTFQTSLTGSRW